MTPTSSATQNRHDTLSGVTSKGTARQTIRVDPNLWALFGQSAEESGSDRSAVLRDFMRWYNREAGAKLPKRPVSRSDQAEIDPVA